MTGPDDCLFCKIVRGDVPATVVRESERTLSFRDINPQAPTHVLVVPKEHHAHVGELAEKQPEVLAELVSEAVAMAADDGIAERGYRLVFNTGREVGQTVFHVHLHVMGGRAMSWPPG